MHKIKWQEVTWYSRIVALIVLLVFPFLGFYYGMQYGESVGYIRSSAALTPSTLDYYHNVSAWQTTKNPQVGFSIAYPLDFWVDSNNANNSAISITIPAAFEPQTNFVDAKLAVRRGGELTAANCFTPAPSGGPEETPSVATIAGVEFKVFYSSDAAAGNHYDMTSYRALHGTQCYEIAYTIHSSQLANYPAQYQLNPFSKAKVIDVMNRMVGTFKFL